MTIKEQDFRLIPISDSTPVFNLEFKNNKQEFKTEAYGISIEYAVKKIAHHRVCNNHADEAISLCTYFKEFQTELNSIKQLLKL